jgi:hypothetical protein
MYAEPKAAEFWQHHLLVLVKVETVQEFNTLVLP